jgi:Kinase binding protein CGI-121
VSIALMKIGEIGEFRLKTFRLSMSSFELSASEGEVVHVLLFSGVENSAELKARLRAGDAAYLYAFMDARMVIHSE